ncbi:MAG: hypothetical protein ACXADB_08380, partial [Candidatus Hermodarchaeia archaeon]
MALQTMRDALRFQYKNATVTVIASKTLDEFTIHDSTFGPVEKGREFDVPRWVANVLISTNRAQPKDPVLGVPDLQKALWRETG